MYCCGLQLVNISVKFSIWYQLEMFDVGDLMLISCQYYCDNVWKDTRVIHSHRHCYSLTLFAMKCHFCVFFFFFFMLVSVLSVVFPLTLFHVKKERMKVCEEMIVRVKNSSHNLLMYWNSRMGLKFYIYMYRYLKMGGIEVFYFF